MKMPGPRLSMAMVMLACALPLAAAKKEKVEPTEWTLVADMDDHPAAVLRKGETREQVLSDLGKPRRVKKSKKVPDNETLYYRRSVLGPLKESTVRGSPGMILRTRVLYIDEVEVVLEKGIVATVELTRRESAVSP